jgi:type VI secretion system protein ImpA
MSWRTDLLEPIPGENPCGADLRYDPIYGEIKEARREEVDVAQGAWASERKVADWTQVIRLCGDVLAKRSKDIQIGVWLTEAMLRREGFGGLKGGLDFLGALLSKYWDQLYPEPEDGDLELRSGPLEWMGSKLGDATKFVPINTAGHSWSSYMDTRGVPLEDTVKNDAVKLAARKKLIDGGKLAPEAFEKAVADSPKAFYKQLVGELDGCLVSLKTLGNVCDEKFGDVSPSFGSLRKAMEEVRTVAYPLLKKKLELDPDPPEEEPIPETAELAEAAAPAPESAEGGLVSIDPTSPTDAVARVAAAAKFLRRAAPGSPASYLMLRGLRWGEVRAGGSPPSQKLLEAPSTAVRTQLKTYLLDHKWAELLEASELAMAQGCGRGWIDLQRYAITACDRLGAQYHLAGKAMRSALFDYLAAVPQLVDMTMMDDTPAANAETQAWLAAERNGNEAHSGEEKEQQMSDGRKTFDVAMDAVRSGDAEGGIGLLMRELSRESSTRGRFRRKTELAAALVAAGREPIALPILQELAQQIEAFKLEEWEGGQVVAQPLVLLYKCMAKAGGDAAAMQALYLRICRLDPLQALTAQQ